MPVETMPVWLDNTLKIIAAFSGLGGVAAAFALLYNMIRGKLDRKERQEKDKRDRVLQQKKEEHDRALKQDAIFADRLRQAIEHLGSNSVVIQKASIYEFERLAVDSKKDRESIKQILFKYFDMATANSQKDEVVNPPLFRSVALEAAAALSRLYDKLGDRIDLEGYTNNGDFRGLQLRGAFLIDANFSGANLEGADFRKAILFGANFSGANLQGADFCGALPIGANFSVANLQGADFRKAELFGANLSFANFSVASLIGGTKLPYADFFMRNLQGADLREAGLKGANLQEANLEEAMIDETTIIDESTKFSPGVREKYFPWYEEK
ncbi:MAG: pentapeptide repeat-containing protein [Oscillospiraceae bacterium]|nr:pentapeptide repeat-containing protein [Oscillospiraceae bacterium]